MYDLNVPEKAEWAGTATQAWLEPTGLLLRRMEEEARVSPDREAYRELVRTLDSRLGLTAALGVSDRLQFITVVLVDRSPRAASIEARLARRGYASMCLDDGWIAHERAIPRARLGAELRFLRGLVEGPEGSR